VRRFLKACLLLFGGGVMTFGCSRERPRHPDVFIISIDTLRADHLPLYGYKAVATPNIDALGHDGVVFANAYSHCPLTLPSHVSLFTGLLPAANGVHDNVGYVFDPSRHPTLASLLKSAGYRTGAAISAYVLRRSTGVAAGFDTYDDEIPFVDDAPSASLQRPGFEAFKVARDWLASSDSRPRFFFLHLYEPHAPYTPPVRFRNIALPYDGEIAAADAIVGDFLGELRTRGLYDDALVVLLSDHGEGLMEHGEQEHGILLYREDLHVPLIVKLPGNQKGHSVDRDDVQLVDILPTVLDLAGLPLPGGLSGNSLLPSMAGDAPLAHRVILGETFYPRIHFGWSELRSAIRDDLHFIESPHPELFDAARDPQERQNLLDSRRRVVLELWKAIDSSSAAFAPASPVDREEAAKLAALGYVTAAPSVPDAKPADPKEHLGELNALRSATEMMAAGRYGEAEPLLRALLEGNPGWSDVRDQLGVALDRSGDLDGAIEVYQQGIRRTPQLAAEFALSLGSIYLEKKQYPAAASHARLALSANAPAAHQLLGEIALAGGDLRTAAKEADAAAAFPSQSGDAELLRARIDLALGNRDSAMRDLRELVAQAAKHHLSTPAHTEFLLGDTLARSGESAAAEQAFAIEIRRFPDNVDAYVGLGLLQFAVERQPARAVATLQAMCIRNPSPAARRIAAERLTTWGDAADARLFQ